MNDPNYSRKANLKQFDYSPEQGDLVRVTYKFQAGNYRWSLREMTAIFLSSNPTTNEHWFSMRPKGGTTSLTSSMITNIELVMSMAEVRSRYNFGARDAQLPVKLWKTLKQLSKEEALRM